MSNISANLVKILREKTGAGMMDCKKALSETGGDLEQATDWLRKKGLAAAAKKAGRVASEGLIGVCQENHSAALIEINSETDFVARNPEFQKTVSEIVSIAAKAPCAVETLLSKPFSNEDSTVEEALTRLISVIGENISLRRVDCLTVTEGVVAGYIHGAVSEGLGRIGVIVALESKGDKAKLQALGKKIAMHIAAASPQALTIESLDPQLLEREKNILIEQARTSNRPDSVIEKMVEGRVRKFYEEVVLLEQVYVIDGKKKISEVLEDLSKEIGSPIKITSYVRYALGEGIEKETTDFAAEVQQTAGTRV